MADKGKKAKGGAKSGAKKAPVEAPKAPVAGDEPEKAERAAHDDDHAHDDHAHDDHAHGDHGHGAGAHAAGGHGHAPNYREYFMVFGVLFALTVLEVAVTKVPGINRKLMALSLVGIALTKAAFVGLFYMHLKHETKILKLTVALPMAAPTIYALVLISEAAWRLTR
jgi:cytochrome c oxidase subunit 4